MMLMIGKALVLLLLACAAVLTLLGVAMAEQKMQREREMQAIRRATEAAMRTDAHLARLRAQNMRVAYRESR